MERVPGYDRIVTAEGRHHLARRGKDRARDARRVGDDLPKRQQRRRGRPRDDLQDDAAAPAALHERASKIRLRSSCTTSTKAGSKLVSIVLGRGRFNRRCEMMRPGPLLITQMVSARKTASRRSWVTS